MGQETGHFTTKRAQFLGAFFRAGGEWTVPILTVQNCPEVSRNYFEVSRDRILEIVAGLIIVGILWSLRQTYDLNAKVSALDSNVTASNSRMDRIATAIPSVAESSHSKR